MSDANIPHLVELRPGEWVQPAHVTRVSRTQSFVFVHLVDGSTVDVPIHEGKLLYRDAEAVVSALDLEIGRANGERG